MIDEKNLRDLIDFRDDIGVLSFYAGFTPEQAADPQPTTPLEIRNRVKELRAHVRDHEERQRAQAIASRLDAIEGGDLAWLIDPKEHGRGRALFVAVSDGRAERLALQIPFRERVVFHERPYLRPLVAAHDEGRAAGILVVHRAGLRVLEWAVGEVVELESRAFGVGDAQLADIKSGPSPAMPQHQGEGVVNRERFEDRIHENLSRFLKAGSQDVAKLAADRGWDRVVIAGAPKIRDEVRSAYAETNGTRVLVAEHTWENAPPHRIADDIWPLLRSVHRERERQLVERARDAALSGGPGALGIRRVLSAINQGQVDHLLFDSDLRAEGYVSEEGTLHAEVRGPEAQADLEMRPEPLLVERMVEKVMEMSGKVTPVDEDVATMLDEHGGVAATLRWSGP